MAVDGEGHEAGDVALWCIGGVSGAEGVVNGGRAFSARRTLSLLVLAGTRFKGAVSSGFLNRGWSGGTAGGWPVKMKLKIAVFS